MNPYLKQLHGELAALHAEAKTLMASDNLTDEQKARAQALPALMASKKAEIEAANDLGTQLGASEAFLNGGRAAMASATADLNLRNRDYLNDAPNIDKLRSLHTRAKYFAMVSESKAEAKQKAYKFGQFLRAVVMRAPDAIAYCQANGIQIQKYSDSINASTGSGGANEAAGALIIPEFEEDMIILRETFGMFRKFARYTPMISDTKSRPRRQGGLVAYHVGAGVPAALSMGVWDRVQLTAKKVMVLSQYESEVNEDAIGDFGDTIAGEMAYAMTVREDQDGFTGDGTSTYGGIVGVINKLLNTYTAGGGLGLHQGTAPAGALNHWTALTLTDFAAVKGILPEYTEKMGTIQWFCHKTFFEEVMAPIALSAGGVTAAEVVAGVKRKFMGYDVVISQAMPNSPAAGQVPVFLGALELAADFGDRRKTTIAFSEHAEFAQDNIVAKCTERYDINCHDCGTTVAAGPVVGMVTQ